MFTKVDDKKVLQKVCPRNTWTLRGRIWSSFCAHEALQAADDRSQGGMQAAGGAVLAPLKGNPEVSGAETWAWSEKLPDKSVF